MWLVELFSSSLASSRQRFQSVVPFIFVLYTFYMLITTIGSILRRKHFLLRKHWIGIMVGAAILQWTLATTQMIIFKFDKIFPSWVVIWQNSIVLPLCIIFSLIASGMHVVFEVVWMRSLQYPRRLRDSLKDESVSVRVNAVLQDSRIHAWLKNYGASTLVGILSSFHILVGICLLIVHDPITFKVGEGQILSANSGGAVIYVFLYMVIWCPLVLIFLQNVSDAYGLFQSLQRGIAYAFPFAVMYICMRQYPFLAPVRQVLHSYLWLAASMLTLHIATVTVPLIKTFTWSPDELTTEVDPDQPPSTSTSNKQNKPLSSPNELVLFMDDVKISIPHRVLPLRVVLENPGISKLFHCYCKRAFVWDSISFYQTVEDFRHQTRKDPSLLEYHAELINQQFIEPGSPFEMNLSYQTTKRIHHEFLNSILYPEMFDVAQDEILRLVSDCTYRNFLYTLDPEMKARFMVPIGQVIPNKEEDISNQTTHLLDTRSEHQSRDRRRSSIFWRILGLEAADNIPNVYSNSSDQMV